jgi:Antitoxin VbhA
MAQGASGRLVAGYRTWQRIPAQGGGTCQVRRGAKGLVILAPRYRVVDVVDERNPEPDRQRMLTGFGTATVFDETALVAPPDIPRVEPRLLDGHAPTAVRTALVATINHEGFPVVHGDVAPANGVTSWEPPGVVIRPGLGEAQELKTLAHEAGHVALHHPAGPGGDLTRPAKELEAESVAYLVGHHLGLDTADFSVPYVTGWAGGDPARVLDRADRVVAAAHHLTGALDHRLGVPVGPWSGPPTSSISKPAGWRPATRVRPRCRSPEPEPPMPSPHPLDPHRRGAAESRARRLVHQALGSARLDGLTHPDPRFVAFLAGYAAGEIGPDEFEARVADVVAAAVEEEQP